MFKVGIGKGLSLHVCYYFRCVSQTFVIISDVFHKLSLLSIDFGNVFKPQVDTVILDSTQENTGFNSLPDNKFLDWSKLKQIADNILTHYQTTNFRLFQIERVCRQFQI